MYTGSGCSMRAGLASSPWPEHSIPVLPNCDVANHKLIWLSNYVGHVHCTDMLAGTVEMLYYIPGTVLNLPTYQHVEITFRQAYHCLCISCTGMPLSLARLCRHT